MRLQSEKEYVKMQNNKKQQQMLKNKEERMYR